MRWAITCEVRKGHKEILTNVRYEFDNEGLMNDRLDSIRGELVNKGFITDYYDDSYYKMSYRGRDVLYTARIDIEQGVEY